MLRAPVTFCALSAITLTPAAALAQTQWVVEPIARSGDPVPGVPGFAFAQGGVMGLSIDNSGAVVFQGAWLTPGGPLPSQSGLFYGTPGSLQPVFLTGQPAPGVPGSNQYIQSWIGQYPRLSKSGILTTAPAFGPNWPGTEFADYFGPPGALTLAAYSGGPPPGSASGTVSLHVGFPPSVNNAGHVAFTYGVLDSGAPNGVSYGTIVTGTPGQWSTVASTTFPVNAIPGATFSFLYPNTLFINDPGQVLFLGDYDEPGGTGEGYFRWSPTGTQIVAATGMQAPTLVRGVTFAGFFQTLAGFSNSGRSVFGAAVEGPGIDGSNAWGIWTGAPGDIRPFLRSGDPAPGFSPPAAVHGISDPALSNSDYVAAQGTVTGPGITSANDQAVWLGPADGPPAAVLREGEPAPGMPLGFTIAFSPDSQEGLASPRFALNDEQDLLVLAGIAGPDVTTANNVALWFHDWDSDAWSLLLRTGDVIDGHILAGYSGFQPSIRFLGGGAGGLSQGMLDNGTSVVTLQFTDGTWGVYRLSVPEPASLVLMCLGPALLFRSRQRSALISKGSQRWPGERARRCTMFARTVAAALAMFLVIVGGVGVQTILWQGTDAPTQTLWFDPLNWAPQHVPLDTEDVKHLSTSSGSAQIEVAGGGGAVGKTFEGQLGSSNRTLTINSSALSTLGNIFRTGSGTPTYTVRLLPNGTLSAGALSGAMSGEIYGFTIDLQGSFSFQSSVFAKTKLGYGPVQSLGLFQDSVTVGDVETLGAIDCAYAGAGNPTVDPITASPWIIGNGTDSYFLSVQAATIDNVGDWRFRPFGFSSRILANVFDMWANGGTFEMFNVNTMTLTNESPFPGTGSPFARFDGTSQWQYGVGGSNIVYFRQDPFDSQNPSLLTFSDAASLLRPSGCPTCPSPMPNYPTSPLLGVASLEIHDNLGALRVQVNSKVSRDALAFDAALADLWDKGYLELEGFTTDVCNIEFMDALVGLPDVPLPSHNRCVKYWHDLHVDSGTTFVTTDNGNPNPPAPHGPGNQEPDYVPAAYPPEGYYFDDADIGTGVTVMNPLGQRLYARTMNAPASTFPFRPIGMTRYMDADLDFDTDVVDFARFQNAFTGAGGVTWYPLADFGISQTNPDADCDVDREDFGVLYQRWWGSGTGFMVCDATHLPDGVHNPTNNANLGNGSPDTIVCGGPLHVRPTAVPPLDCPNCELNSIGCGSCGQTCPWTSPNYPINPDGRFEIALVDASGCNDCAAIAPNGTLSFKIVGRLVQPELDSGLALWSTDLWTNIGGATLSAATPANAGTTGVSEFVSPAGINNPAGYGGTLVPNTSPDPSLTAGWLVQIGGAQNTVQNGSLYGHPSVAAAPSGLVAFNVAHDWTTLAEGTLTVPSGTATGTYSLNLANVIANAISLTQASPTEFYRTERAQVRRVQNLIVRVVSNPSAIVEITSAMPPVISPYDGDSHFRDPLQTGPAPGPNTVTQGIGAAGTTAQGPYSYAPIQVTFSAAPSPALAAGNVSLNCTYTGTPPNTTPCPTATAVSGSGVGPYSITLSGAIPPGGCTTITFTQACGELAYEFLPADVNLDGLPNTQDLLRLIQVINDGSANQPGNLARYNVDRSGPPLLPPFVNTVDLLRLTQLLNGVSTTQVWNGVALAPCPHPHPPQPICGGGAGSGNGGSSAPPPGGNNASEADIAAVIAAVQAACAASGIAPATCQQWLDNLFAPP